MAARSSVSGWRIEVGGSFTLNKAFLKLIFDSLKIKVSQFQIVINAKQVYGTTHFAL